MAPEGADERRIRSLLRRRGVGPDAEPQPVVPAPRDPDWLDRLYADEQKPEPAGEPAPWWTVRKDPAPVPAPVAGEQQAPGVHVTITPTAPADPVGARKARIRWWVIRRGTAAGVGWIFGLEAVVRQRLEESGQGAVGFALLLWLVAWFVAAKLLRFVPREAIPEVHDAADWAAHIPSATVLLALALNTPGALS